MTNYVVIEELPWYNYRAQINTMIFDAGVTSVSSFSYFAYSACTAFKVLNPSATFYNYSIQIVCSNLVLYGFEDSTAQAYANTKGITFSALD